MFVQKSEIFRKILEIVDDHNFGTEYVRDMKFVSKCAVLDTLLYYTNNAISTKSEFIGPFGNELFIYGNIQNKPVPNQDNHVYET